MLGVDRFCKHQTLLKAMTAKESALSARKPLVGGLEPHLCYRPFKPRAYIGIYHILPSNLTTGRKARPNSPLPRQLWTPSDASLLEPARVNMPNSLA